MICNFFQYRLNIAKELSFKVFNMGNNDFITYAKKCFGTALSLSGEAADIDIWVDAAGAESIFNYFIKKEKIES